MKRYRVMPRDFDSRSMLLKSYLEMEILDELSKTNKERILAELKLKYGELNLDMKVQNFLDIDSKPFSIIAYHNKFLEQIRNSFVIGSYFSALTASCALGERILNHLILNLRDQFKDTQEYSNFATQKSFSNWTKIIDVLSTWKILLPEAVDKYKMLANLRHKSLHFNLKTETDDREYALQSIKLLQGIVTDQFAAYGNKPWFIISIPGEHYLKRSWEHDPYVKLIYIPNAVLVGAKHTVSFKRNYLEYIDDHFYGNEEISDEEFVILRNKK